MISLARNIIRTIFCVMVVPSVVAEPLSLVETYRHALDHGTTFSAALSATAAEKEDLPLAESQLLPKLSISGNYTVADYDKPFINTLAPPMSSSNINLMVTQPVYQRSLRYKLSRAEDKVKIDDLNLERQRQQIAYDVSEAYLNEILTKDTLSLAGAERESYRMQLDRVVRSVELGLASKVDLLESRAKLDNTDAQLIKSRSEHREAGRKLQKLIGEEEIMVETQVKSLPTDEKSLQHLIQFESGLDDQQFWLEQSVENIQQQIAALGVKLSRNDKNIASSSYYPTLSLSAGIGYSKHDDPLVTQGADKKIMLELNIPLYDGGHTSASVRKAEARITQASEELRDARENAQFAVLMLLDTMRSDRANVDALMLSVKSAEALLHAVEESQKMGLKDVGRVLDAKTSLYSVKRELSQAIYDAVLHRLELSLITGQLTEKQLQIIDNWLSS